MAAKQAPDETPEQIIADAQAAIAEADKLAADLEQRVLAGDDSISAEDLRSAKDAGVFARLRLESRKKKAAELADQRKVDARAAIIAEHLPIVQGVQAKVAPLINEAAARIEEALRYADIANDSRRALLEASDGMHNPWYPEPEKLMRGTLGELHHGGQVYGLLTLRTVLAQLGERFGVRIDDDIDHVTRWNR